MDADGTKLRLRSAKPFTRMHRGAFTHQVATVGTCGAALDKRHTPEERTPYLLITAGLLGLRIEEVN
jgi:hypothetical protein